MANYSKTNKLSFYDEENYLREVLGTYHPSTYFRAVYTPYDEADIARIERQIKTGRPAFSRKDYDKASTWKEKERLLLLHTTAYHEAFHYFQSMITSYGIIDQYIRTACDTLLLEILLRNDGLPGMSLVDYVSDHASALKGTALSREIRLISAIMDGSKLYAVNPAVPLRKGSIFRTIQVPVDGNNKLPQVCIELHGTLYPFGAEALIESWTYSAMRAIVALTFGNEAAADYTERMNFPLFPYRVLDFVVQQICRETSVSTDALFMSIMCSVLAYYGLSGGPFNPNSFSIREGCLPGLRTAYLVERLREHGSGSHDAIFDACDHAMMLDEMTGWPSFFTSAYRTHDSVVAYMSKVTGHDQWHLKSINLAPFAWFTAYASTEILSNLLDTGIIFDVREWLREYRDNESLRPLISLFVTNIGGKHVPELRAMPASDDEVGTFMRWYVLGSIIEQRLEASTFVCPLSRGRHSACPNFDMRDCKLQFTSLSDSPKELVQKDCSLIQMLHSLRISEKGVPDLTDIEVVSDSANTL